MRLLPNRSRWIGKSGAIWITVKIKCLDLSIQIVIKGYFDSDLPLIGKVANRENTS